MSKKKVLIIGGYGKVGLAAAKILLADRAHEVTLAGRDIATGRKLAGQGLGLNSALAFCKFDVFSKNDFEKAKNFDAVLMCIDQQATDFVQFCLVHGIHYIDVTASDEFHQKVENLKGKMLPKSMALLSVGIAPGLTNLMAKEVCAEETDLVKIHVLLGNGEKHGRAAVLWTLHKLKKSVSERTEDILTAELGPPLGSRRAFPFDFSDQHSLRRTFTRQKFVTRVAFEQKLLETSMNWIYHMPWLMWLLSLIPLNILAGAIELTSRGTDIFVLKVESKERSLMAQGFGEGQMTGIVAATAVKKLLNEQKEPGIFHIHELFSFSDFKKELDDYLVLS